MRTQRRSRWLVLLAGLSILFTAFPLDVSNAQNKKKRGGERRILWRDPGNIRSRDLFIGPGSRSLAPAGPFRFMREVAEGKSPKFDVEDSRGVKWRIKLGREAQTETAATRLLWAVGYNAEESYYFERVKIDGLPRLTRGRKYQEGNYISGARFEPRRNNVERGPSWDWTKNPFKGSRELDGLKVMMVLLGNWDVKKGNNSILYVRNPSSNRVEAQYAVTDVGGSFGAPRWLGPKANLKAYQKSRFVRKVKDDEVKFDYDIRPNHVGLFLVVFHPPYFFSQLRNNKAMNEVRLENAIWIGSLLARLSDNQLRDSFRAAGYDAATTEAYARSLRLRIKKLNQLADPEALVRARRGR